jgi:glycosyltransferase involved in cell wall biosynthesis
MWAFTGGCHYDEWCNKYKNNCGKCKVLNSKFDYDLSRSVWNRKNRVFSKTENITIVGLSNWLAECAKNSSLLKKKTVVNLPNPIDTNKYKPIDKSVARELLNLPQNKKIILFGAMSATSDKRKGYSQLIDAVNKIEEENIELVVFGNSGSKIKEDFKYKINFVGKLKDDISLQILYSAADVMIVPSLQENLSNVILESLSCAIPVVAFDIGGNSDMIEHKNNGYLAKPFDTYDLAKGIEWILNSENYSFLCENARNKAINEFDSKIVANRYIDLYKKIIDKTFS